MDTTLLNGTKIDEETIKMVDRHLISTLLNLDMPARDQGFFFAKECAKLVYFEPTSRFQMNELVFKAIAKRYGTTASKVERSIRHVLSVSISQKSMTKIENIFKLKGNFNMLHPSVCEFLCLLAESIAFSN